MVYALYSCSKWEERMTWEVAQGVMLGGVVLLLVQWGAKGVWALIVEIGTTGPDREPFSGYRATQAWVFVCWLAALLLGLIIWMGGAA
jgi:hypothetical protein